LNLETPQFRLDNTDKCGRPLGLRRLNKNLLICTDAYLGIITIDVEKGRLKPDFRFWSKTAYFCRFGQKSIEFRDFFFHNSIILDKVEVILEGDALVEGTRIQFADDLDLLDENTIVFSDASTKYRSQTCPYNHIESQPTGR
jgi:hypothetical protein